jgi:exosortase J
LRWRRWTLLTAGAVVLGYLFNFLRLSLLVIYYVIALKHSWLQDRAAMGDYILGACLFFVATALLFSLLLRWSPKRDVRIPPLVQQKPANATSHPQPFVLRCTAFAALIVLGSVSYARAMARGVGATAMQSGQSGVFPKQVGEYSLQREWNESMATGPVLFHWGEYARRDGGPVVSIGVSPVLGAHDTLICHAARGENWIWHGPLEMKTAAGETSLSASLFNDGATQYLEAAAVCSGATCGQVSTERSHLGLIYSRPSAHNLLTQSPARPIPILLRAEIPDAAMSAPEARAELTQSLTSFLSGADLAEFTRSYRQR